MASCAAATPVSSSTSTSATLTVTDNAKKLARKDKESLCELDSQVKDIRSQLNEQLRCLDVRMETQISVVGELQDFFRRRAEVELDYSKNLDKLSKSLLARHKEQKQKREQWHLFSSYACWQHLVGQTKRQARDHAILSDIYANTVIQRLSNVTEEVQRIYRRCREVGYESHEELLKVLHELHTAMKTSQTYQVEMRAAETKLRYVESQRAKLESSIAKEKLEKSKKFKLIEKEIVKRRNKFNDAHLKALKARNEYVLCMDAANSAIHKYFIDDLSDIIDCMDIGFHNCVARALLVHVSAEENIRRSLQVSVDGMNKCLSNLDSRADKQRFLEANHTAFMIPKKFDAATYQKKIDEGGHELSVVPQVREEFESRYLQLHKRLTSLRAESEEVWKTLETAESSLMDMISAKDYDVSVLFAASGDDDTKLPFLSLSKAEAPKSEAVLAKLRADRQETEDFYLSKFREYVMGSNLMHRLTAKYELIHKSLAQDGTQLPTSPRLSVGGSGSAGGATPLGNKPRRRRIGRTPLIGQPKLFAGSLEEYLEATNQEIPLIMKSCIRVINLYGLHHQGIFRVSGSQVEINNFREAFERGEDPLADVTDASDINSVAGVFKLYLRELREPLFPILFFDQFMQLAQLDSKEEFRIRMREVVETLPRPVFIVMRYLFSFLNHLSEFSDENMMDPYNLAICFGPTLVPVPEDKDQVQFQNLVNELIKNIIINSEDIFPVDGGVVYERYISREPDEAEVGEAPSDTMSEEMDSEVYPSEDDSVFREKDITLFGKSETLEAIAQFDFTARSQRELSFKKGDILTLYTQVSSDWWKGTKDGRDGLIPDKYILLRIRDEDRERMEMGKLSTPSGSTSSGSEDSVRQRASSSSEASGRQRPPKISQEGRGVLSESNDMEAEIRLRSAHSDSVPSLPSPSVEKRFGRVLGPTVALVRPTTLSCPTPVPHSVAITSSKLQAAAAAASSSFPPVGVQCTNGTSSIVSAVASGAVPIVDAESASTKENRSTEGGKCTTDASSMSLAETEVTETTERDDCESLALSDEKSLADSFTSLAPEASEETEQGAAALLEQSNSQSLQNLDVQVENDTQFRRQAWETRSMTNLERVVIRPESKVNVSVGGWSEPSNQGITTKGSFVRKRDLWEKRASVTSSSPSTQVTSQLNLRQKHTPDLVMDLPPSLALSSSPKDDSLVVVVPVAASATSVTRQRHESETSSQSSSSGSGSSNPGSPGSPEMTTAAETFARQNQSTLKKSHVVKLPKKEPAELPAEEAPPPARSAPTVKLQIATYSSSASSSASSSGSSSGLSPAANPLVRPSTTPKLGARFSHLYGTPMPVLPVAFAAQAAQTGAAASDSSGPDGRPQVKLKPQVLRKPTLPSLNSPESTRRSGVDQDSVV